MLDSVNRSYSVRLEVWAEPAPGAAPVLLSASETGLDHLLDFNGGLRFGATATATITSVAFAVVLDSDPPGGGYLLVRSLLIEFTFQGDGASYGASPFTPDFRLLPSGLAVYDDNETLTLKNQLSPGDPSRVAAGGLAFNLGPELKAGRSGVTGTVGFDPLPAGMGWSESAPEPSSFLNSTLENKTGVALGSNLAPAAPLAWEFPAGVWVMEESKPVAVRATAITWVPASGRLELTTAGHLHHPEALARSSLDAAPVDIPDHWRERCSNQDVWLLAGTVATSPRPYLTGADGSGPAGSNARITLRANLQPGWFKSHFPEAVITTTAATGNLIQVENDLISTTASKLLNTSISIPYMTSDPVRLGSNAPRSNLATVVPADETLNFTATGGLWADCPAANHSLIWGWLSGSTHAFSTSAFQTARFFMPGAFYPQGRLDSGGSETQHQSCPGNLLLSGQTSATAWRFSQLEKPGTQSYRTNSLGADYAGLNFRAQSQANATGVSVISGTATAPYPLADASRYYVRKSGVTGIHCTDQGPGNVSLFGFNATMETYGLSFLSSEFFDSVTDATLAVPYPAGFSLPIEKLGFDSSGTPLGGKVAADGPLTLSYWAASALPLGMEFISHPAGSSSSGILALESAVSLPSLGAGTVLQGKLGFRHNGHLVRPADNIAGISSRLRPPTRITFNGPAKGNDFEKYHLVPVCDVYLNHYPGSGAPGDGFLNIAGTLDVAFFQDLQIHMQASANAETSAEIAVLHLTGGWKNGTDTFFNKAGFDPENRGHPAGVTLENYRNGNSYRAQAKRVWMDSVNFQYPLVWDDVSRTFATAEEFDGKVDLLVFEASHRLEYLSAEQAALDFGARYEGIPNISIGNMLISAIDGATGGITALEDALVGKAVGALLWAASDAAAGLLNDSSDALLGPVIEDALGEGVLTQVIAKFAAADGSLRPESEWTDGMQPLKNPGGWVCTELVGLAVPQGGANAAATRRVQDAIDAMIDGLDVFVGNDGLLAMENGRFTLAGKLVYSLIDRLASQEIKAMLGIRSGGAAENHINAQATALLDKYAPALRAARERMLAIRDRLVEIRNTFNPNQMLAQAIQNRFAGLTAAWGLSGSGAEKLGSLLEEDLKTHLHNRYGGVPQAFADPANRRETADFLIRRIRDRVAAAAIAMELQVIFRQQLQDVQSLIDQTANNLFGSFRRIIRDLVAEVAAPLDSAVSNFTDELSGVVSGAGVEGHAVIRGDTLSHLRLDATLSMTLDEPVEFKGYIEINQLQSNSGYGNAREIIIGASGVPVRIMKSEADFLIETRVVLGSNNQLKGLGGRFEMISGTLDFEGFEITEFGAAVMFGVSENYLAAKIGMKFSSFRIGGGLFVGHSNTLEPLRMVDPDVAAVINPGPITGIYIYGEVYLPIVDLSCLFRVSAGLGFGAFYFTQGPTYGGKIKAAVDGEALCVVSVSGEVVLVGAKSDIIRFRGRGRISGKLGWCPFCVKFKKQVEFTYDKRNGFKASY